MADMPTDMLLRLVMWAVSVLFTVAAIVAAGFDRTVSAITLGFLALTFMRVAAEIAQAQAGR